MSTFKVETGVKIPSVVRRGESKYPFASMKANDSFLVEAGEDETIKKVAGRMRGAIAAYLKRGGAGTFTCRTVENGVRIWRTA